MPSRPNKLPPKAARTKSRLLLLLWVVFCGTGHTAAGQELLFPSSGTNGYTLTDGTTYTLQDPGGSSNYPNYCSGSVRIASSNGSPIHIFGAYQIESDYDSLYLFDGEGTGIISQHLYNGSGNLDIYCYSGVATLRFVSDGSINDVGFTLSVQSCLYDADIITLLTTEVSDTSIAIAWYDSQPTANWTISYGLAPDHMDSTVTTAAPQATLSHLAYGSQYYFRIFRGAISNDICISPYFRATTLCSPTASTCIDYAALNTCHAQAHYGNFNNPDLHTGFVNQGSGSIYSRHTVHTDPDEYDPRTNYGLRCVPPGFEASVRLGNWGCDAQAESITYTYHVDTLKNDLLIMKYAAVLENPNHSQSDQPRFRFQIMDSNFVEIDLTCYSANFVSSDSLGWNRFQNVLWKDWTTVGVDLAPLHGQTIHIKLTTYDCLMGDHYGYAYFVFDCTFKNLASEYCGNVVENTFTAPDGFAYNWHRATQPGTTLSTEQSLHVTQAGEYRCTLQFVGAPAGASCSFDLVALAGGRYPTALMDWYPTDTVECKTRIQFLNKSVVSHDAQHQQLTTSPCEGGTWIIDNAITTTENNPTLLLDPGQHTVSLIATLGNGSCQDTLTQTIDIGMPCILYDTINAEICEGQTYALFDTLVSESGTYLRDSIFLRRTLHLTVWPTSVTVVDTSVIENELPLSLLGNSYTTDADDTIRFSSTRGCDSIFQLHLHVWHNISTNLDSTICQNDAPLSWNGETFATSGTRSVTFAGIGSHGVDSTVTMQVTILANSTLTRHDTLVENSLPTSIGGCTFFDSHADTTWTIANAAGCDSTITYSLHVWHNVSASADSTICQNSLPLTWNGHTFADADSVTLNLATIGIHARHGEDSTLTMRLNVLRNSYYQQHDTVVQNALPTTLAGHTFHNAVDDTSWTIANATGCDSIITYSLHVWHNISTTLDSTICQNDAPLSWNGETFATSGTRSVTFAGIGSHGVDSTVTMQVTILANSTLTRHDTLVENSLPTSIGGCTFFDSHADTTWTIANAAGCDSTITYSLHVWHNVSASADSTICQNSLPLTWNGHTFADADSVTLNLATIGIHARHGEDSTLTMRLNVLRNSYYQQHDTVVQNALPTTLAGHTFHNAVADTSWTIANAAGCDSIITYSLHVWHNYHHHFERSICDDALPLTWCDTLFTSAGNKQLFYLSIHGADSIVDLTLTVFPTYDVYDTAVICHGDTSIYGFTNGGNHDVPLSSLHGCDSLLHLNVIIKPVYHFHFYDTICDNQHVMFEGRAVNTTGHQEADHLTIDGCDSLLRLDLVVHPTSKGFTHAIVCDGVPYTWENGVTYYHSTYEPAITYSNVYGCDSTILLILDLDSGFHAEMNITPAIVEYTHPEVRLTDISQSIRRQWFFNGSSDTSRIVDFTYPMQDDSMAVLLVAANRIGCIDSVWSTIRADRGVIWAPNVFTPDESTNNRFFIPSNGIVSGEVFVYNRKGLFITRFNVIDGFWDGTHNGHACPQESYVWILHYTTKAKPRTKQQAKGTVTLLR